MCLNPSYYLLFLLFWTSCSLIKKDLLQYWRWRLVTTYDMLNSPDWMYSRSDPLSAVPWSPKWTGPTNHVTEFFEQLMAIYAIRTSLAFTECRRFNIVATKASSIPIGSGHRRSWQTFLISFPVPPGKYRYNIWNYALTASFHILSSSLLSSSHWCHIIWVNSLTASLNWLQIGLQIDPLCVQPLHQTFRRKFIQVCDSIWIIPYLL
jgi:hypothetical protein